MTLLDGKQTAQDLQKQIALDVRTWCGAGGKIPHLAAILVGNDGASESYVAGKVQDCENVGFKSSLIRLPVTTSEAELLAHIQTLNEDADVDGFIVQLPLPKHMDADKITQAIAHEKDVDGFHPINVGRMAKNLPAYIAATPFGILKLLAHYDINLAGKHAVVLGRSQIVGSPMSILLARNASVGNCTVTLCHSKTPDITKHTLQADIIVVALGIPEFLKGDMIREGAIVIDVGITRVEDTTKKSGFRLIGDVHFESVAPKCAYITPVPGGVGPMTRVALLYNTLSATKKAFYVEK